MCHSCFSLISCYYFWLFLALFIHTCNLFYSYFTSIYATDDYFDDELNAIWQLEILFLSFHCLHSSVRPWINQSSLSVWIFHYHHHYLLIVSHSTKRCPVQVWIHDWKDKHRTGNNDEMDMKLMIVRVSMKLNSVKWRLWRL